MSSFEQFDEDIDVFSLTMDDMDEEIQRIDTLEEGKEKDVEKIKLAVLKTLRAAKARQDKEEKEKKEQEQKQQAPVQHVAQAQAAAQLQAQAAAQVQAAAQAASQQQLPPHPPLPHQPAGIAAAGSAPVVTLDVLLALLDQRGKPSPQAAGSGERDRLARLDRVIKPFGGDGQSFRAWLDRFQDVATSIGCLDVELAVNVFNYIDGVPRTRMGEVPVSAKTTFKAAKTFLLQKLQANKTLSQVKRELTYCVQSQNEKVEDYEIRIRTIFRELEDLQAESGEQSLTDSMKRDRFIDGLLPSLRTQIYGAWLGGIQEPPSNLEEAYQRARFVQTNYVVDSKNNQPVVNALTPALADQKTAAQKRKTDDYSQPRDRRLEKKAKMVPAAGHIKCYRCQQDGHYASSCSNEAYCDLCDTVGHSRRECELYEPRGERKAQGRRSTAQAPGQLSKKLQDLVSARVAQEMAQLRAAQLPAPAPIQNQPQPARATAPRTLPRQDA